MGRKQEPPKPKPTRAKSPNHSESEIDRALDAWIALGSSEEAAQATGIKASTIRNFKHLRPQRYDELRQADLRARDAEAAAVRDARRSVAAQVATLSTALAAEPDTERREQIIREIDGLTKSQERLDKMGRLEEGRPTEITEEQRGPAELAAEHAKLDAQIADFLRDPELVAALERARKVEP